MRPLYVPLHDLLPSFPRHPSTNAPSLSRPAANHQRPFYPLLTIGSLLAVVIFVAGYITARYSIVSKVIELVCFSWDNGVVGRIIKGFAILSLFFFLFFIPIERIASQEVEQFLLMSSNALMRIFWPYDAPRTEAPGLLIGWINSDLDIFVVSVVTDVDHKNVANALSSGTLFRKSHHSLARIFDLCGRTSLHALGLINESPGSSFNPQQIHARTTPSSPLPLIICPRSSSINVQVIMYDRPNPRQMQYLSLSPIALALTDTSGMIGDETDSELQEKKRKLALVEKLKLHTVSRPIHTQKELSLGRIVDQINCSYEVKTLLQANMIYVGRTRSRRSLSVSERVVVQANSLWRSIMSFMWSIVLFCYPYVTKALIIIVLGFRMLAEAMLECLEWRLKPEWAALKDISATAQQFDIRLQQFCYWPIHLWLVANDIIIGMALGSYIIDNANTVAQQIDHYLVEYSIDGLTRMIYWLMAWPAGLKLNTELARFLGDLFLWVINYWADCMTSLRPYLPGIIYLVGVSSLAGASMPIALFSDLLSVLTIHIYSFYIASARIYNWQLTIIISLFHLFRGKKRNILRNRIDSCDYGLDQLLVGTIIFTLLFFLLPTVVVFYLTFASARMTIITLKAGLETMLACLNHFPLFALMLRLKDSKRLPGGIRFELIDTSKAMQPFAKLPKPTVGLEAQPHAEISYIRLNSVPLPFSAMFHQYFQLGQRIRKHYVSPKVILCLLTGQHVPPIHRKNLYSMQYSMLPTERASVMELWKLLTEDNEAQVVNMRDSSSNYRTRARSSMYPR
ncbi:Gpi1-domain-containing protein [Ascobolus immersus RN42]|uniref:Gpi1-domain-containing protein n=1 Tax=Ascobolus immersus RN42 TaxID=1160509 RepID=A0A3N4HQR3_ASCIM|nr:Gpi1-domain-containing protein [Ascobolus immersus RN42]